MKYKETVERPDGVVVDERALLDEELLTEGNLEAGGLTLIPAPLHQRTRERQAPNLIPEHSAHE